MPQLPDAQAENPPLWKPASLVLLFAAMALAITLAYSVYGFFRLGDDTYIYLQYAKHLIRDGMLAFNAGERSYGFTSPLWLLLLTGIIRLSGDYLTSPELLSLLCTLGSIVVWGAILQRTSRGTILFALLLVLVAADPNLLMHSLFGMEASLSFLLSSLLVLLMAKDSASAWQYGLIAGAAMLVRPESVVVSAVILLSAAVKQKFPVRFLLTSAFISLGIILPWLLFAKVYFGRYLPDTFAAKGASFEPAARFFLHITDTVKIFGGRYGFILLVSFFGFFRYKLLSTRVVASILAVAALVLFYAVALSNESVYARYYCLVFPFFLYVCVVALSALWESSSTRRAIILFALAAHIAAGIYFAQLKKAVYEDNKKAFDRTAIWANTLTSPGDAIITGAIGRVAFDTERKIIDPLGIVNADIIPFNKTKRQTEYFRARRPKFAIGNYNGLMKELSPFARITVLDSFSRGAAVSLRDAYTGKKTETETLRIYRLEWLR